MGTEIVSADLVTGSLTPSWKALLSVANEADLDDHQFALVVAFARAPMPASPTASEEEIDQLLASMAATLKAARTETDRGRLKLAIYRRMLGHLPLVVLQRITHEAIRTLEWMPSPAELLELAKRNGSTPEAQAHTKAQFLTRERRQRLFDETLSKIERREIPEEELGDLDQQTASVAATRAHIVIMRDGSRLYRTRETAQRWQEDWENDQAISGSSRAPAQGSVQQGDVE